MNVSRPIASQVGSVSFGLLTDEEIRVLSVKRIQNPETFDSLLHPVPGGLYDLALGAFGDNNCTTCHQPSFSCPGHPGHIELPVPIYHASFMESMLRLLRAQCACCGFFRLARTEIYRYMSKLHLLRYGLLNEARVLDDIADKRNAMPLFKGEGSDDSDSDDDENKAQGLIEEWEAYVNRAVKKAERANPDLRLVDHKNEALKEERTTLIRNFLGQALGARNCTKCHVPSPLYRKVGFNKIFRDGFTPRQKQLWTQNEKKVLAFLSPKLASGSPARKKRRDDTDEGIVPDIDSFTEEESSDVEMSDAAQGDQDDSGLLDDSAGTKTKTKNSKQEQARKRTYVNPSEVHACLSALFEKEHQVLGQIFDFRSKRSKKSVADANMFFIHTLLVPPNKFRPSNVTSGQITEAEENTLYKNVLRSCIYLDQVRQQITGINKTSSAQRNFVDFQNVWVNLQDAVNSVLDSDRNPMRPKANKPIEEGIKQRLEKKDGLFRQNMMGKRVNFAARTVISPDPNIETNEIGVPPVFATKLTYPEPVTNHNFYELKAAVLNGAKKWPGAAAIENENGQVISLGQKTFDDRQALANQLLAPTNATMTGGKNKKVHRHLRDGDVVLMNRQPTLHKPSIMAHRARVLSGEKTLRMHYANCNAYNADFDGDEMNMHLPQNEIARSEAYHIADTDHQYLVATAGKPLRGLIQDHLSICVALTSRDTFFERSDYYQLLCSCLRIDNFAFRERVELVPPAIVKPRPLWTGKQVVTTVLKNIIPAGKPGLTLTARSQTPGDQWDPNSEEGRVVFYRGHLLSGILDKGNLGPAKGGFIHAVYEAYGHATAGRLLSVLGRLLTKLLNLRAFSCGIEDLTLTAAGDAKRREMLREADSVGFSAAASYVTLDHVKSGDDPQLQARLESVVRDEAKQASLDAIYNSRTAMLSSEITKECLPIGLWKPFPRNQMQTMTLSGAKGSKVNANLISCNLGQQVLEGRRVPLMVSGKTLPSFKPFETHIRAGGYISDRFLTGIKPQEYFFHAMAGREGLIDTAVKTSRSGYLQRCLVKGMEALKVEYDSSVRDIDGSVVQFLYGEDGLDVTKQKMLTDFKFISENYLAIVSEYSIKEAHTRCFNEEAAELNRKATRRFAKTGQLDGPDPVLSLYNPGSTGGSTSESFIQEMKQYMDKNPDGLIKDKKSRAEMVLPDANPLTKNAFTTLLNIKYLKSVIDPGEAVGIVAGQSIGEPSTQMTLNTFHLAGHAAKNVTLGIPRLREIVMTASRKLSTPTMTLYLHSETSEEEGRKFAKGITKLTLAEIVDNVQVREKIAPGKDQASSRVYAIRLNFFPAEEYQAEYAITIEDVAKAIKTKFVLILERLIRADLKKRAKREAAEEENIGVAVSVPQAEKSRDQQEDAEAETAENAQANDDARAEIDSEDEVNPDDDTLEAKRKNREHDEYDAPDEEEEANARDARERSSTVEMEDEGYGGSPRSPQPSDDEKSDDSDEPSMAKEREEELLSRMRNLSAFAFDDAEGAWCELTLEYDLATAKTLMLSLVEAACRDTVIQSIAGLRACTYVAEENAEPYIMTEGVNLVAARDYQHVLDPHRLRTNDIAAMLRLYGVEAARATIVQEMRTVFELHSIAVDPRHLNLIADMMTRAGGFAPFSRLGMRNNVSPLAKMSFETTVNFLKDAVMERDWDELKGPSASIVAGRLGRMGTGSFDVMMPLS